MYYTLKKEKTLKQGFTFVELIIAIAILGVLALVVVPYTMRYLKESRIKSTETNIKTLQTAIDSYYASVGKFPSSLEDLVRKPADVPLSKWVDRFLKQTEVPKDAWGNDFVYNPPAKSGQSYELYSYGPNGPGSTEDEWIGTWKK